MRIVITGAGGFVGRALVERLRDEHDLVGIDVGPLPDGCLAVSGDLTDPSILEDAFSGGCDAVVHLATAPGGAAEADPALAKRVNIDATMAITEIAARRGKCPRFVFASSVAVFGAPLPALIDDGTPLSPRLVYGAHKAMMETWIASQSPRRAIDGLSLRLPGIVARPASAAGFKSAFMSDVFHALKADRGFVSPVSADATMWMLSVRCLIDNITHALTLPKGSAGGRAITLPALRIPFRELVGEIAAQTGFDIGRVTYAPDVALEAAFGSLPPLLTPAADALGFVHDVNVTTLVAHALARLV